MYKAVKLIITVILTTIFRWRITGLENIPSSGGVIIAPNHISLWDPPLVGCALPRTVHFMAKEELFAIPVFNWIIRQLQAFPVKRGAADRNAIRKSIELLQQGEVLGLFPEGTRSKNGQLGEPEQGVAMIAVKAGVPIIPAAITGTNQPFYRLPRFTVAFGKPIAIPSGRVGKEELELISKTIMKEIEALRMQQL